MTTHVSTCVGAEIIAADFIKPGPESCLHGEDVGCASPDVLSDKVKGGVHFSWHFKVGIVLKLALLCPCFGTPS